MSDRPVWLLDVDGVVNAATKRPDRSVWPLDQWVRVEVLKLPILAATPVLDFIRTVHMEGRAEIRWHTTWQDDAPGLGKVLDLPEFPVADAPEYRDKLKERAFDRSYWWKAPAVRRVLEDEGRPVVWTDDDIIWSLGRRGVNELRGLGPLLAISPNERTGLTPKHLRQIGEFLDLYVPEESR